AIEEKLFDKRRDLFADLSAVFMDTTSLSFYGEGGETLGEHGYSKDYRPDLHGDVAGQYGRRRHAAARHRPFASPLFHRTCLRRRRSRHDLGGDDRGTRSAQ